jgi:hypothetical protein
MDQTHLGLERDPKTSLFGYAPLSDGRACLASQAIDILIQG